MRRHRSRAWRQFSPSSVQERKPCRKLHQGARHHSHEIERRRSRRFGRACTRISKLPASITRRLIPSTGLAPIGQSLISHAFAVRRSAITTTSQEPTFSATLKSPLGVKITAALRAVRDESFGQEASIPPGRCLLPLHWPGGGYRIGGTFWRSWYFQATSKSLRTRPTYSCFGIPADRLSRANVQQ